MMMNAQISGAMRDGYLRVVQRDVNDNGQLDGSIFNNLSRMDCNGGNCLLQQSSSQNNIAIGGRDVSGTGVGTTGSSAGSSASGVINPRSASGFARSASQQQGPADMMQMLMPLMMMMFQLMMQMFQGNMGQGSIGQNSLMSQQGTGLAGNTGSAVSTSSAFSGSTSSGTFGTGQPIRFLG
jgi:hypothetical protein